jgi:hypothetical protein
MLVRYLILFAAVILIGTQSFPQQSLILQRLSGDADLILTGKVTKQQSGWIQNKTRIVTYTTIKANDVIKGNPNQSDIVVVHPGGEIDGIGELYTHMPTFKDDEEVLLFLKKDDKSSDYNVLYGEEGKIALMNSPGGEKVTASQMPVNMLKLQIQKYLNRQ